MAGMRFEYDETGTTFYYFLLAVLTILLLPATYWLWPTQIRNTRSTKRRRGEKAAQVCACEGCDAKQARLEQVAPSEKLYNALAMLLICLGWAAMVFLLYKVSNIEVEILEWCPFEELGLDKSALEDDPTLRSKTAKRAYRDLSKIYHPDKPTGDHKKFVRIQKAHQTLTNQESYDTWISTGSPDGPSSATFGIALPKWIVEKENSVWVLGAYLIAFMVILPSVVGAWWYRSIKFNSDQVLLETQNMFGYLLQRNPNMIVKRVIHTLAASREFGRMWNAEIVERPSDNLEVPLLLKKLPAVTEKAKEWPYMVKTRAIIHAHLSRIPLTGNTLELDRLYILSRCQGLLSQLVVIAAQLVRYCLYRDQLAHMPRLETLENVMKVQQMLTQALWDNKSPLLQLPHLSDEMLRHFVNKRRQIRSLTQLAALPDQERRSLLRQLNDEQYRNVLAVLSNMPSIEARYVIRVMGDDDERSVTAGSLVTLDVFLTRRCLLSASEASAETAAIVEPPPVVDEEEEKENQDDKTKSANAAKRKAAKRSRTTNKRIVVVKVAAPAKDEDEKKKGASASPKPQKDSDGSPKGGRAAVENDDDEASDSEAGGDTPPQESECEEAGERNEEEDDENWQRFQAEAKKDHSLEAKSRLSHPLHCPYFPTEKQEYWWLYVCDRKKGRILTNPTQITSLQVAEETQLKFTAPPKPGVYQYQLCVKSDSYLDMDVVLPLRLDVKAAPKFTEPAPLDSESEGGEKSEYSGDESESDSDEE